MSNNSRKSLAFYGYHRTAFLILICLIQFSISGNIEQLNAQVSPPGGLRENKANVYALTKASIVTSPGNRINRGTVLIRDGIIQGVGANISIPADATIIALSGMTIYAGLIESYSNIGFPEEEENEKERGTKHWNSMVWSEVKSYQKYKPDEETLKKYRKLGFTSALSVPRNGIFMGTSALVNLGNGDTNKNILKEEVAQHITFNKNTDFSTLIYPNSLMGTIALIRQTLYDADWYRRSLDASRKKPSLGRPEKNESLASLISVSSGKFPVIFEAKYELMVLRIDRIAKEFKLKPMVVGSGMEFKRIDAVKATRSPMIIPLAFPNAPDVTSSVEALDVSLRELKEWDLAPSNPGMLNNAGVTIALTTRGLKKIEDFPSQLRKAIARGLSVDAALAALTTTPARMLGVSDRIGTVEKGKIANLVVSDGDLFSKDRKIREVWIDGQQYKTDEKPKFDPVGKWTGTLKLNDESPMPMSLELKGSVDKLSGTLTVSEKEMKILSSTFLGQRLAITVAGDSIGIASILSLSGKIKGNTIDGWGEAPGITKMRWSVTRSSGGKENDEDGSEDKDIMPATATITYPLGGYGRVKLPVREKEILLKNATIWTSGKAGILQNTDILFKNGKISKLGSNLKASKNAVVIDGTGKHVTPGLIDEHSHTAKKGMSNELTQSVTAEVRIGDILSGDRIALYRELAGGLTMSQELHGSGNPIGGQAAVIKVKYGALPKDLLYTKAPPTIKFALGENVKRSNWNPKPKNPRYPKTRLGVEQLFRDEFRAAQDYQNAQKSKKGLPFRRDLELDAISDILNSKMFVHTHSYRQDEILMLMRVAEDFGFRIATFTHVLEGYKIADELKKHGAGASTFSDWWMYKFEVYDAIPYNAALMHKVGVVTSFNSDDNQLARMMNTEAAKAVAYGGVSEEEALKFVTINPAIQLKIDKWTGSLEVGKDADFVVWNGHPLSTLSKAEQTWIDGAKWFDVVEDAKLRAVILKEREELIQKILSKDAPNNDKKGNKEDNGGKHSSGRAGK